MSTAVQVGKETTHGTIAGAFTSVPCNFSSKIKQVNRIWEEDRQGQDRHFAHTQGHRMQEISVADSAIYHDTIGFWLYSAMGQPTSSLVLGVRDNVFKFADDPPSLSLKWQQPRRYTQAYQALNANVDKMDFKFAADGDLVYSLSGLALGETEISQITHSFSSVKPMPAWAGTVTLNGANTRLVSGQVSFTRNRKAFHTINNLQDPQKFSAGPRMVEFDLLLDFVSKSDYDDYKAATSRALTIVWADTSQTIGTSNPQFTIKLGTIVYEEGEVDTAPDLPMVKVKGKALYNVSDASLAVITVRSTLDYAA